MTSETMQERGAQAHTADAGREERASDTRQFVTFITGGEVVAVDMAEAEAALHVAEVVQKANVLMYLALSTKPLSPKKSIISNPNTTSLISLLTNASRKTF